MPITNLSADQQRLALEGADSDIKWLLSDNSVKIEVQAAIFHSGFNKLKVFSGIGESRTEARDALKNDIGLDSNDGVETRVQVAMVLAAWEGSRTMITQELKTKADFKAADLARPLPNLTRSC